MIKCLPIDRGHPALVVAVMAAALLSACAHTGRVGPSRTIGLDSGVETVFPESIARDGERVARLLPEALAVVTRSWGELREPLRVELLPDHAALEAAVERKGYPWLRAWARRNELWLQAPSTWGLLGASDATLRELLVHELTHAVMYQRAANGHDWRRRRIPVWFREGMASWTARQGYRRTKLPALATWLAENPGDDPLAGSDRLYQHEDGIVYGAAHHAFVFLVDRYGVASVRALMARMYATGETFPDAFRSTIGLPMASFEADFDRFVRLEGWRRS